MSIEVPKNSWSHTEHSKLAILATTMNTNAVSRLIEEARKQTGCRAAFLYAMQGDTPLFLGSAGFTPLDGFGIDPPTIVSMRRGVRAYEYPDMAAMPAFADDNLVHKKPAWRYAVSAPIPCPYWSNSEDFATLVCFDAEPRLEKPSSLPALLRIADILNDVMHLLTEKAFEEKKVGAILPPELPFLLRDSASPMPFQAADQSSTDASQADRNAVAQFLQSTLIKRQRLLSRKSVHYLALRSWAKPVKQYQINALRSLKAAQSSSLIDDIAAEMAIAIKAVHGVPAGASVVPVPCGHSGPNCMSAMLAQSLARQLGLNYVDAFQCQPQAGSSHPKTNVRRPRMKLKAEVTSTIILVDDVAASGSHIEEAARLLAITAPSVWPIVWVSD